MDCGLANTTALELPTLPNHRQQPPTPTKPQVLGRGSGLLALRPHLL